MASAPLFSWQSFTFPKGKLMIYEVRTYDLKPRSLPIVEKMFEENLEHRTKYSALAAFFHTEIGPLNQIIHIWPYADLAERTRVRGEMAKETQWPPKIQEHVEKMNSEVFVPYPFSPEIKPGKMGPIFEMRSYTLKPGGTVEAGERWEPALPERLKLSPLVCVMRTEFGDLNKFVHIWAYESLNQRAEVRNRAKETGIWPPKGGGGNYLISQENKIMLPAPFSPLQ